MPRENHRRTESSPVMVRLSPSERADIEAKARKAGITVSAALRAAAAAWQPPEPTAPQ